MLRLGYTMSDCVELGYTMSDYVEVRLYYVRLC